MTHDELSRKAAELGFQLFGPVSHKDSGKTLAEVVHSRDLRFWEAFPVMLANAAEAGDFKYKTVRTELSVPDRKYLDSLLLASLAVYETLGVKFSWAGKLAGMFPKSALAGYCEKVKHSSELRIGKALLPPEKLKANFTMYFKKTADSMANALAARDELGLEYAMAQTFSPKQRELFLKRLRHEKLTKTEKEYFSRVVKKKAQALANEELHRLARKVLE